MFDNPLVEVLEDKADGNAENCYDRKVHQYIDGGVIIGKGVRLAGELATGQHWPIERKTKKQKHPDTGFFAVQVHKCLSSSGGVRALYGDLHCMAP